MMARALVTEGVCMNNKTGMRRVLTMLLLLLSTLTVTVGASRVPTDTYLYWQRGDTGEKEPVSIRPVYEATMIVDGHSLGIGSLNEPKYIAGDTDGCLYILDSGNGRIVILSEDLAVKQIVERVTYGSETLDFTGAGGIFVTEDTVCIADSVHERVLVCDRAFQVQHIITRPDSYLIPESFTFAPIRAVRDNKNFTYVLCEGSYYGVMVFTDTYEFLGFFGANLVEADVLDAITEWITSLFTSDEKQEGQLQDLPYQLTDVTVGPDGFIYSSTEGGQWSFTTGELRKMGPGGGNILKFSSSLSNLDADDFRFTDTDYNYNALNTRITPALSGISVDAQGFMYAVDRATGKIYIYDQMCNLLAIFGGGIGTGNQLGTFVTPVSVVAVGDRIYVLDTIKTGVTVFERTAFGQLVMEADVLSMQGDYVAAKPLWTQVLQQEQNYQVALVDLGKAALEEKDYNTAIAYAKRGLDQETYISAFNSLTNQFLEKNFLWLFLLVIGSIVGLSAFFVVSRKREIVLIKHPQLHNAVNVMTHPFISFGTIRQMPNLNMWIPNLLRVLFFLGKMAEKEYAGFMYVLPDNDSSLLFTLIGTVGLAILGVLCNWGISVLFEGKGKLMQCYCALSYCLIPQILGSVLYVVLTHVVAPTGGSVLTVVQVIVGLITVIWLLLAITIIHEFSFFKAIGSLIGTILAMCLVGFILFLLVVLAQDFVTFLFNLYREAFYR